jgi:hypothetical protein
MGAAIVIAIVIVYYFATRSHRCESNAGCPEDSRCVGGNCVKHELISKTRPLTAVLPDRRKLANQSCDDLQDWFPIIPGVGGALVSSCRPGENGKWMEFKDALPVLPESKLTPIFGADLIQIPPWYPIYGKSNIECQRRCEMDLTCKMWSNNTTNGACYGYRVMPAKMVGIGGATTGVIR